MLLPKTRKQEPFHKRVADIEKKAKALEQDREEQQDQFDINEFFDESTQNAMNNVEVKNNNTTFYALDANLSLGDHKQHTVIS